MIKTILKNRKAFHDFTVLEKFEAGIALRGSEVKSIRSGKINISDAFCMIDDNNNLILHNLHISQYDFANRFNHDPLRKRVLLMHKKEIHKLAQTVKEKGLTLIPLDMYFKRGIVKISIGLCKGKKLFDKREDIKQRDTKREIDRLKKNFNA